MDWRVPLGILGVLVTVALLAGAVANLAVTNSLLTGTDWVIATVATAGLVVVFVGALVALGRPGDGRPRTPYW